MKRADLIRAVARNSGLTIDQATVAVDWTFRVIQGELLAQRQVQIPGFGRFGFRNIPEYRRRQPWATGKFPWGAHDVITPAFARLIFQPLGKLKDAQAFRLFDPVADELRRGVTEGSKNYFRVPSHKRSRLPPEEVERAARLEAEGAPKLWHPRPNGNPNMKGKTDAET